MPSGPGILMSEMIRSGGAERHTSASLRPSGTATTWWPRRWSSSWRYSRVSASSSATAMWRDSASLMEPYGQSPSVWSVLRASLGAPGGCSHHRRGGGRGEGQLGRVPGELKAKRVPPGGSGEDVADDLAVHVVRR